jgi:hypothetical protein
MAGMTNKGTKRKNTTSGMSWGAMGRKAEAMREKKSSIG